MTLNKAFKDVYCKFLTEQGYQWCSKLQRFVKVVNQELIYFIGLKKVPAWLKGPESAGESGADDAASDTDSPDNDTTNTAHAA